MTGKSQHDYHAHGPKEQSHDQSIISARHIKSQILNIVDTPDTIRDQIPTLNHQGYMKVDLSEYCRSFIDFATHNAESVLEIGCAYGAVVNEVLKNGGRITACDLSKQHLEILVNNAPDQYLDNLHVQSGELPNNLLLPHESFDAILISRLLHFLTPEKIKESLVQIHNWLKPGGKFFCIVMSPYLHEFCAHIQPLYAANALKGMEFPGVIPNLWKFNTRHKNYMGKYLNLFDIPAMENLITKYHFKLEKISLFNYPQDKASNGSHLGFIAVKS